MLSLERKAEIGIYELCSDYILFSKYTVVFSHHGLRPILDLIHIIHPKEIKIDLSCHAETNTELNHPRFLQVPTPRPSKTRRAIGSMNNNVPPKHQLVWLRLLEIKVRSNVSDVSAEIDKISLN